MNYIIKRKISERLADFSKMCQYYIEVFNIKSCDNERKKKTLFSLLFNFLIRNKIEIFEFK